MFTSFLTHPGLHHTSWSCWPWGWCNGFECFLGNRPRPSALPWPWVMMGLGINGLPNVRLPWFWGRLRLLDQWLLLTTLAAWKSLPSVKELTGGRSHALVHGFRANFLSGKIPQGTVSSSTRRDTLTLFDLDCCACSSCCKAGPHLLLRATLGGVSKRILTIFFVSTHKDHWFCTKRYLLLGSITS